MDTNSDEYEYCIDCGDFVYEYCSVHGPLLIIPDEKVLSKTGVPPSLPRAALTIPHVFLHLARSVIPGAGIGVFSTLTLPRGVRFGPYRGLRTAEISSMYCWQICDGNKRPSHAVDAADASRANWLRYVNCARHWREQNLVAYQYRGQIYYSTIKTIPKFTELLVFYGSEFANALNIDLKKYNHEKYYKEIIGATVTVGNRQLVKVIHDYESDNTEVETFYIEDGSYKKDTNRNEEANNTKIYENTVDSQVNFVEDYKEEKKSFTVQYNKPVGTFNCKKCSKQYTCKRNLARHLLSHATTRKFSCCYCEYKTNFNYALKNHTRIHTKEIIFKCACGFSTHSKDSVRRHVRHHTK